MCVFNPSHSKILFNLWGWLWQSDHRSDTLSWGCLVNYFERSLESETEFHKNVGTTMRKFNKIELLENS
ncbi:hypothetical protein GS518_01940 [Leptospira interrogans]|uniref:Uncharacterized protein n=9 Tax=Leptospira interrogans TaxID=173 RepID=Q8F8W5_LEPIN|nr:hypothetical protein LA_0434 [Leptospira interrogans serovar Lai str. 56601]AAS69004.1 conserved hypothetical protein [Leptospira interrogans serovar Copenhageni str. Fiocruz L1-130]AER01186.1 hypothetical protein LIF_A0375 [Leptospira interrogans serovar Lai str. IPAV]AKH75941.1 hypothetical protein BRAT_01940 [Leptospira interrogans serovar Bratislava]ARB96450.1 hypothetical protein A6J42_13885 [Leptospira interrogans serovar Copenhageni]EKR17493.1 hypothetical protein LEP1GSC019_1873 [Le